MPVMTRSRRRASPSEYGVRVYTVGFGTAKGNIVGFGGFSMRAQLDEVALKKIADMTEAAISMPPAPRT